MEIAVVVQIAQEAANAITRDEQLDFVDEVRHGHLRLGTDEVRNQLREALGRSEHTRVLQSSIHTRFAVGTSAQKRSASAGWVGSRRTGRSS
jgi:hypothetical protein